MCRLLLVNLKEREDVRQYIESFSLKCRASKEYQGDGFGIAYLDRNNKLQSIRSLKPIWDASDIIQQIPHTTFALVHARSAFGESTIGDIDNNQPFGDENFLFAFNGNLKGVSLKAEGKIGAHKIFNLLKESGFENIKDSISRIINNARYVMAFNIIAIHEKEVFVHNQYSAKPSLANVGSLHSQHSSKEDTDYFNMWELKEDNRLVISSEKLDFLNMNSLNGKGSFNYSLF